VSRAAHPSTAGEGWDQIVLPADVQTEDAASVRAAFGPHEPDWIVTDHYQLDQAFGEAVGGRRRMVIDDLANRHHACDLLLDQTFGRDPLDYRPLVQSGCTILTGPQHAPLRPEFADARPRALARRSASPAQRLLVSIGTADLGGVTGAVLDQVLALDAGLEIDVVLGRAAPSLPHVLDLARRRTDLHVHIDSNSMAELMVAADVAVGAAGTTSWERCCLALPALVVVLADNQRLIAQQLHDAGAQRMVDSQSVGAALRALLADGAGRDDMAARAARVTDGLGSRRVFDVMAGMDK
jgi:UDP-2,4-diacetamido-2,4,6-trideoxy-beta-L-altropyranose hydrolase